MIPRLDSFLSKIYALIDTHLAESTMTRKQRNKKPWVISGIIDYSIVRITITSRKPAGDNSGRADTGI